MYEYYHTVSGRIDAEQSQIVHGVIFGYVRSERFATAPSDYWDFEGTIMIQNATSFI